MPRASCLVHQRKCPKLRPLDRALSMIQTSLHNHGHESLAIDFAVVPTISFDIIRWGFDEREFESSSRAMANANPISNTR